MYYGLINSMNKTAVASYTARTTAFASATGITDATILNALNTFDLGLISNSLDSKMKAVYPMVGGSASTHKYNFFDPRDLDVAFRLTFNGGWTHSSNGALPNGTNAYSNTFLKPSVNLPTNSVHTSYYSRTSIALDSQQIFFDAFGGSANCYQFYLYNNTVVHDAYDVSSGRVSSPATITNGYYIGNRLSASKNTIHRNGLILNSNTTSGGTPSGTLALYMSAANTSGGAVAFGKLECAFSSIGDGLTDTEASAFYTLVQNLQIALNRQV